MCFNFKASNIKIEAIEIPSANFMAAFVLVYFYLENSIVLKPRSQLLLIRILIAFSDSQTANCEALSGCLSIPNIRAIGAI